MRCFDRLSTVLGNQTVGPSGRIRMHAAADATESFVYRRRIAGFGESERRGEARNACSDDDDAERRCARSASWRVNRAPAATAPPTVLRKSRRLALRRERAPPSMHPSPTNAPLRPKLRATGEAPEYRRRPSARERGRWTSLPVRDRHPFARAGTTSHHNLPDQATD